MRIGFRKQIDTLLRYNLSLLGFGFLLSFFSSFGQTFLLSLYVPSIESLLGISNTEFGAIYAVATIGSALTLPWIGGYFDKVKPGVYTLMVVGGLFAAQLLLSFSYHILLVVVSFYGLRLFGQGLLSHTSISTMARYFSTHRGKAIGTASLGHPAGEAVLPLLVTLIITALGWRAALQLSALATLILLAPLAMVLLYHSRTRIQDYHRKAASANGQGRKVKAWKVIRERRFWIITPIVFIVGFTNTAIFFFQLKLGDARGWSPEWVAGSISAFAISGAVGVASIGTFIDRFSARRLFPFHMFIYGLGVAVLILFEHPVAYPVALALIGLGQGTGRTIKDAMLAEVYGVDVIGRIRSIFITIMVVSTAVGPIIFGVFLDRGVSYSAIFTGVLVVIILTLINGMRKL